MTRQNMKTLIPCKLLLATCITILWSTALFAAEDLEMKLSYWSIGDSQEKSLKAIEDNTNTDNVSCRVINHSTQKIRCDGSFRTADPSQFKTTFKKGVCTSLVLRNFITRNEQTQTLLALEFMYGKPKQTSHSRHGCDSKGKRNKSNTFYSGMNMCETYVLNFGQHARIDVHSGNGKVRLSNLKVLK